MKLTTLGLPLVLGTFLAAVAYSASQPCASIPVCPTPDPNNEETSCANNTGTLEFGPVDFYDYYHCNGRNGACGHPGTQCNVMVKTSIQGRTLECVPTGPSGLCAISVTSSVALNLQCSGGGCIPGTPADSLPTDLIPPYPGLPSQNPGTIEVPVL